MLIARCACAPTVTGVIGARAEPIAAALARLAEGGIAEGLAGILVESLHPRMDAVAKPATTTRNGTRVNMV
jgi:hypothetical protein